MFCISIMKKLYSLNTSSTIRTKCYLTFIQSVFIYHLFTIFGHVSKTCQSDLDSVISLASSMAHCNFPSISAIYEQCFKQTAPPCLNCSYCPQAGTDSLNDVMTSENTVLETYALNSWTLYFSLQRILFFLTSSYCSHFIALTRPNIFSDFTLETAMNYLY